MQNKIQDIDWALSKLKKSTRGKEWRKTVDDVFDETTLRNIQQLFNRGVFGTIENMIATGKEANLFRAKTFDGRNRAVKIYRLNTATFRKLNRYIEGDPRFKNIGNSPRDRVFMGSERIQEPVCYESRRCGSTATLSCLQEHSCNAIYGVAISTLSNCKGIAATRPEKFSGSID